MTDATNARRRLQFLARVVDREKANLITTDRRLFAEPFTVARARQLASDAALAERVEAFVGRFGRLQDTVGDKLLPAWLSALGERPGAMIDNLNRAERLGIVSSADSWLTLRRLRNQMVHEYIEDMNLLANALQTAHDHLHVLIDASEALLSDLHARGLIPSENGSR